MYDRNTPPATVTSTPRGRKPVNDSPATTTAHARPHDNSVTAGAASPAG